MWQKKSKSFQLHFGFKFRSTHPSLGAALATQVPLEGKMIFVK